METKQLYEVPTATVVEVLAEGMVCESIPDNSKFTMPGYDNAIEI